MDGDSTESGEDTKSKTDKEENKLEEKGIHKLESFAKKKLNESFKKVGIKSKSMRGKITAFLKKEYESIMNGDGSDESDSENEQDQ